MFCVVQDGWRKQLELITQLEPRVWWSWDWRCWGAGDAYAGSTANRGLGRQITEDLPSNLETGSSKFFLCEMPMPIDKRLWR